MHKSAAFSEFNISFERAAPRAAPLNLAMKPTPLLPCIASSLLCAAGLAQAAPNCEPRASEPPRLSAPSAGRQSLGEGMALFDARKLGLAERALQTALFLGLADGQEQASAHKYLALVYCSNGEWARCETAFDAAFEVAPLFQMEAREIADAPWRDAYLRSLAKSARQCGGASSGAQRPSLGPQEPVGFALTSSVIVSVVPLRPAPSLPGVRSTARALPFHPSALLSGNNVRLRVSPWAYVQVDGKRLGVTPALTQFKLNPGSHTIELHNPGFEAVRKVVRLPHDGPVLISHDFEAR